MAPPVNCRKHTGMGLDPQDPCEEENGTVYMYDLRAREQKQEDPGAHWPITLTSKWRHIASSYDMHRYMHIHTCNIMCTHSHIPPSHTATSTST